MQKYYMNLLYTPDSLTLKLKQTLKDPILVIMIKKLRQVYKTLSSPSKKLVLKWKEVTLNQK